MNNPIRPISIFPALLGLILTIVVPASASTFSYSSRSAWESAAGTATLIDFEAQNPNGPASGEPYGSSLPIGDVLFQTKWGAGNFYVLGSEFYPQLTTSSDFLFNWGSDFVQINFATPISAFAFEVGTFSPDLIHVFLYDANSAAIDLSFFATPALSIDPMQFVGMRSDQPISSIVVEGNGFEMFDNFMYVPAVSNAVPESGSTIAMFGAGLIGLSLAARRNPRFLQL